MSEVTHVYGLETEDSEGVVKSFVIKADAELDDDSRKALVTSFANLLRKPFKEVDEALFLYENPDGSPCTVNDLYEEVGPSLTKEEKLENLQRLQDEADEECGIA